MSFGHFFHSILKLADKVAPIAFAVAGQPELAAAYSGVSNTVKTGSPLKGLESAGLTYAGNAIGSEVGNTLGSKLGTFGDYAGAGANSIGADVLKGIQGTLGDNALNFAGNAINKIANTGVGATLGALEGNSLANSLMPKASVPGPSPFAPSQASAQSTPASLSSLSNLTPAQQATNVATQGVYGGGNGPDEQSYFTNLVNRQLVDNSGKVSDLNTLAPIETSYLDQIGLGGYKNSNDLLKALTTWHPA